MNICIFSEYAYSLLKKEGDIIGGAELQMVNLARGLSKRSHNVSFVVFEKPSYSFEEIDGISVYNPFNLNNSGYSYLKPKNIYFLIKALNKIDSDIFIQRAGTPLTGILSIYAKLNKKIFLYSVASDDDVSDYLRIRSVKDLKRVLYITGVWFSTCVICQSINQKKSLIEYSEKIKCEIIKNMLTSEINNYERNNNPDTDALWVGRCDKIKRPEIFINLAKKLPNLKFKMICRLSIDPEFYHKISQLANETSNLEFLGFVPHEEIYKYYLQSKMLVCTSLMEGFPNTFLEAWVHGMPVVSLGIDPDGIISKYNLGICSRNFDELVNGIKILSKDIDLREKICLNSREYIFNEHSIDKTLDRYEYVLSKYYSTNKV